MNAGLILATRYRTSGVAGSAADQVTAETGERHRAVFRPQGSFPDHTPFIVEKVQTDAA